MAHVVFVGTEKGAFFCRSTDGRKSWTVDGPHFKGWKATTAARAPDGNFLLATASRVYGAAIHKSADLEDWRQIEQGPAYPDGGERKLTQIWTIKPTTGHYYAGVDQAGLFRSDDAGETWQPVPGLNDHPTRASWFPGAGGLCAHHVVVDHARPERIWVGISAVGVFRSDDGGETWHAKNNHVRAVIPDKEHADIGFCVHGLTQDPRDPQKIYRQDHVGMYRSHDGGDSWEKNDDGMPSWFGFPIAVDPHSGAVFAFPMESDEYRVPVDGKFAVYRSKDGGDSWHPCTNGLPRHGVWSGVLRGALCVDGEKSCGVYVGTTGGEVFASADAGDSWQRLPCTLPRVLSVASLGEV